MQSGKTNKIQVNYLIKSQLYHIYKVEEEKRGLEIFVDFLYL